MASIQCHKPCEEKPKQCPKPCEEKCHDNKASDEPKQHSFTDKVKDIADKIFHHDRKKKKNRHNESSSSDSESDNESACKNKV